jgi:CubicO group peptidase (beta-lactamase class C family)
MRYGARMPRTAILCCIGAAVLAAPLGLTQAPPAPAEQVLTADTPSTTVAGNTFIAPSGWRVAVRGPATVLAAPEPGSQIALVDVDADSPEAAVAKAWAAYKPDAKWPLKVTNDYPDKDGWSRIRDYSYQTSPNERRDVGATARFANGKWTVILYDMEQAVGEKRGGQVALIFSRLLPKGYERESFAGRTAHALEPARLDRLRAFVAHALRETRVPGAAVGIVQGGKVVLAEGFGTRELGSSRTPDADTLFMIASNTKALATLMLARLVDQGKLTWESPASTLLPSFKLGDDDTTRQVRVKHLICACTGMPRQDFEWLLQYKGVDAAAAMGTLATVKPTSKFGEMFQYSNGMAAAAGFIGGHVAFPDRELGAAFDEAMRTLVFEPLGMTSTTFDFARALSGNHATAHAPDVNGTPALAVMDINYSIVPVRPAGGAWSSVRDMLKYVQMELDGGLLPGGARYISSDVLLARRNPQVSIGHDRTYGMGLMVTTRYDATVVHHGGDMIGYHSDMLWLPEHNVGAVILTNGDGGWLVRDVFRRKLLEVLFDGRPEADAEIAAQAKSFYEQLAAERKLLTVPPSAFDAGKLASRYSNPALGDLTVARAGGTVTFDFGEWRSPMASRRNPDGTVSFLTIGPGIFGLEFVVGSGPAPTLVVRDAQHEYVFDRTDPEATSRRTPER